MAKDWSNIDAYFTQNLLDEASSLPEVIECNKAAGLPAYDVTANQGKFLCLLARMRAAKRILEIGTLGGYSTIWLARALPPDGCLVTLELDPGFAEVARSNVKRAGCGHLVDIRIGPAAETLRTLAEEPPDPFDFVFIDADKQNNDVYLEAALKLSRPGTVMIVDNVVRHGAVIQEDSDDPGVHGIRRMIEQIRQDDRVDATVLQTVGDKGHDGFLMAIVND